MMNRSTRFSQSPLTTLSLVLVLAAVAASPAAAQDHDLVLAPALDVTSMTPADRLSPDVKVGAELGDASVPDVVRRGVVNPIYARFYVNGTSDHLVANGAAAITFHWRNALAGEVPPALGAPGAGWNLIGSLPVTWAGGDPTPFLLLTKTWPTDYPSAVGSHLDWTPPAAGDLFHLRAEAVYPPGTSDDNPGDNVAVSLYESMPGIADVDLVIAHDLSGSMLTFMYGGDTYLAQAEARAQAFVASMNENHRLAVVGFGGCLPGGVADVWPSPIPAPLPLATFGNKLAALVAINGLTVPNPGCLTPMGVGVQRAVQALTALPPAPGRKRTILLLTDGYENSGVPRACPDTLPGGPCLGSPLVPVFQTENTRVFSIALGAAAWTDCLVCVTDQSDGQWYAPAGPGIDLAQVYLDMQQAVSADDLYRADRGVTGGGDDAYSTHFEGLDDLLYFILQSDRLDAEIDLELRPPGGAWQRADNVVSTRVVRDRGYVVARVGKPAAGTWGYRVVGKERQDYLVAVRSDRVGVRLSVDVQSKGRIGSPIFVKARLTDRGEPLRVERLVATVRVPVERSLDAGLRQAARKLLLEKRVYPVDPNPTRNDKGDLSPRSAFIDRLTDGGQGVLERTRVVELPLERQRDGSFSGVLERPVEIAGTYTVTVAFRDEKADREMSRSVRLGAGEVDFQSSFAELIELEKAPDGGPRWLLRVYPTDRYGNAITDRALLKELDFTVRGAKPATRPDFAFDSAIELRLEAGERTPVLDAVTLGGKKLRLEGGR